MRNFMKRTLAGVAGVTMLLSASMAWAGPTVGITVNKNWAGNAENNPRDCLASVTPAFGIITGASQPYSTWRTDFSLHL
ncbi:hypothetical protein [Agrobacterium tumefaciens]|uniref:hypothetical protein n=1 Tax=Agrobacterium tumefaciens TaxID=358 RepID=UPI001AEC7C7B